uniref:Homeobox domain-containing protein n=1 Tax=Timema genevievae TaxID=629358 RepID=A0A7R9K039_TIMGE|nr:unnamed protein product [Timema genevievae]
MTETSWSDTLGVEQKDVPATLVGVEQKDVPATLVGVEQKDVLATLVAVEQEDVLATLVAVEQEDVLATLVAVGGSQHTTLKKGVLDSQGMEHAQSDLRQGRHVTRRGCDNDDSIKCLDDSDSGDGEAEASWFRNINIRVEENPEQIKTLYEGCLEPSAPMPQTYTCEQMTIQRTYLSKSQSTCRRQGPNGGIEAEENTLSNIGTNNVSTDTFTDEQMVILKWEFEENHFPPATRIKKLSERLRLPESRVEGWFIRKRSEGAVTPSRGKRKKTDLNTRQLRRLKEEFRSNSYPSFEHFNKLSQELRLSEVRVYLWFVAQQHKLQDQTNCGKMTRSWSRAKLNLTSKQINGLERSFSQDPRPTVHQCGLLAQTLGVSQIGVARWFNNRHKNLKEQIGANIPAEFDETLFSEHQLERLNQEFLKSPQLYPDQCRKLAKDLRLSRTSVYQWFYDKRKLCSSQTIDSPITVDDQHSGGGLATVKPRDHSEQISTTNHILDQIVEEQIKYLNKEFSTNKTPSRERIQDLSYQLCVSEGRVCDWFKYRRNKDKIPKPNQPVKKESISAEQLRRLMVEFVEDCYAFQNRRERIAPDLGLSEFKVDSWFKYMRRKMQKTNLSCGDQVAREQFERQVSTGQKSRESINPQTEYLDRQLDARGSVLDKEMNRRRDIERTVNSLGSNAGADGRVAPSDISEYLIPSISLCSSPETVGPDPLTEPPAPIEALYSQGTNVGADGRVAPPDISELYGIFHTPTIWKTLDYKVLFEHTLNKQRHPHEGTDAGQL